MGLEQEGTIEFTIKQLTPGWRNDGQLRVFQPLNAEGITVALKKLPNGKAHCEVNGLIGQYTFIEDFPASSNDSMIYVAITWDPDAVKFYLNGLPVSKLSRD